MIKVCQQNYRMFTTGIKSQCRTRPTTTASLRHRRQVDLSDSYPDSQHRIRDLKQQLKELQDEYKNSLCSVNRIKSSIENTNKKAGMTRVNFLKVYEAKKMKIDEIKMSHQLKISKEQSLKKNYKQTKQKKINEELQLFVAKTEKQKSTEEMRRRNKTQKLFRKERIMERSIVGLSEAKSQFERVKDSELYLKERKRRINELQQARARINYEKKLKDQMSLIQCYDVNYHQFENILSEVSKLDELAPELLEEKFSKSFFLTK